jgi:hypothetical protein
MKFNILLIVILWIYLIWNGLLYKYSNRIDSVIKRRISLFLSFLCVIISILSLYQAYR